LYSIPIVCNSLEIIAITVPNIFLPHLYSEIALTITVLQHTCLHSTI
jgi:hypothetical protein